MEKKTDLSSEFGGSDPGLEFSCPGEMQTDRIPEFNHPPDQSSAEFCCTSDREKEFCRQKESQPRRRKRRGLLLQMSCVALSMVLVTSAFGEDILGDNVFFSDPPSPSAPTDTPEPPAPADTPEQSEQDQPPVREDQHPSLDGVADPPSLYIIPHGDESPIFIVSGGQLTLEGLGLPNLSYDPETNTLTLDNFWGDTICANMMGEDFTIYLKGDNDVNAIYSYGDPGSGNGSLTIDGDFQAELEINENRTKPVGIHLFAEGGSSTLWIKPGIDIKIEGSKGAILVSDTSAAVGLITEPCTMISGIAAALPAEDAAETSDWSIVDPEMPSAPLSYVTFEMAFSVQYLSIRQINSLTTVYRGYATNDIVNTYEFPYYNSIQKSMEFTVTNKSSYAPVYLYFIQYTKHSEPYLVSWEQDPGDEDDSDVIEVDMQGKYFGAGVTYLATDGENLYWVKEAGIDGSELPSDALALQQGESVSFTLPYDGSDSIYLFYTEAYYPLEDHYYWIYSTLKVMP